MNRTPNPGQPIDGCPSSPEGDKLTVVCQVLGEVAANAYGQENNTWNVYEIPAEYSASDTVAYAYGPALWAPQTSRLKKCSPEENPANSPSAP